MTYWLGGISNVVDQQLIDTALQELGVTEVGTIGAPGGQKTVRHVRRATEDLVLKVIAVSASTPDALRRAEREVDLLASLSHPNVVGVASQLIELEDPVRGAAWLEEYLDGQDLSALLLTREWAWDEAADMGLQIARGLASAHEKNVIHRDLSANNVRRLTDGTYKVMDFGFARFTLRSGLTISGQPGTYGYASPEHLHSYSGGPTPASDVFCVGNLMYAALTGELAIPYTGNDVDYIRRLGAVQIDDIAGRRPDLSDVQVALIRRCLHSQPARRFRNGTKLVQALEGLT